MLAAERFNIKLLIHQPRYNLFDRWIENGLLDILEKEGIGCIVFSPLAQGILTDKYFAGIPERSRVGKDGRYLSSKDVTGLKTEKAKQLNELAAERGNSLAQLSVNWVLRDRRITSALIGASNWDQIKELLDGRKAAPLSDEELQTIDSILK